jgi:hypothetical protein
MVVKCWPLEVCGIEQQRLWISTGEGSSPSEIQMEPSQVSCSLLFNKGRKLLSVEIVSGVKEVGLS